MEDAGDLMRQAPLPAVAPQAAPRYFVLRDDSLLPWRGRGAPIHVDGRPPKLNDYVAIETVEGDFYVLKLVSVSQRAVRGAKTNPWTEIQFDRAAMRSMLRVASLTELLLP